LKIAGELMRNIFLAYVLAYLLAENGVTVVGGTTRLSLSLWIGFPVVLLTGSVMWEDVPWKLAAIHAGDWLCKTTRDDLDRRPMAVNEHSRDYRYHPLLRKRASG